MYEYGYQLPDGRVVFAGCVGGSYCTLFFRGTGSRRRLHRYVNRLLPISESAEKAIRDLDNFAVIHGMERVPMKKGVAS